MLNPAAAAGSLFSSCSRTENRRVTDGLQFVPSKQGNDFYK